MSSDLAGIPEELQSQPFVVRSPAFRRKLRDKSRLKPELRTALQFSRPAFGDFNRAAQSRRLKKENRTARWSSCPD
jgi:hypothetical protein